MPCLIALAVCVVLLIKATQHQKTALFKIDGVLTNLSGQAKQPRNTEHSQTTNTSQLQSLPPSATPLANVLAETNPIAAKRLSLWQAPIDFYGKVIDENSNAISGVKIHFSWYEIPAENGEKTADTQTDSEGLFSLHGQHGPSLSVGFSKEGYYSSHRGELTFNYALGPEIISPDSLNPVIFKLRRKGPGQSLIRSAFPGFAHIAQLHHDGTPVELNLINGTQVAAGSGQLKLEFFRDIADKNAETFDWKLQLSVPNGGLVGTDEEFAFQAPVSGYQTPFVIDMPATNQNWLSELRTKYYIQLPDGNYGRIDFYLLPYNGVFTVDSTINPTGLRNLEPSL